MKRIMTDLETLATCPTAAVIAVAMVMIDDEWPESHPPEVGVWLIDPNLAVGTRSTETIEWWEQQSEEARRVAFGGNETPHEVCSSIAAWLQRRIRPDDYDVRFYANPARFDFAIFENLFRLCGQVYPIDWRKERCMRTIEKELNDLGLDTLNTEPEIPHHPTHDCLAQFIDLRHMLGVLSILRSVRVYGEGL